MWKPRLNPNNPIAKGVLHVMDRLSRPMGYQLRKSVLGERAWDMWDRLYDFEISANDREWSQLLMYQEVYLRVKDLPGDIIEFGVGTGVSLMAFARMNEIYQQRLTPIARRHI